MDAQCRVCNEAVDLGGGHVKMCGNAKHVAHLACYGRMTLQDGLTRPCVECDRPTPPARAKAPGIPLDTGAIPQYGEYVKMLERVCAREGVDLEGGGVDEEEETLDEDLKLEALLMSDVRFMLSAKTPVSTLRDKGVCFATLVRDGGVLELWLQNGYSLRDLKSLGVHGERLCDLGLTSTMLRERGGIGGPLSVSHLIVDGGLNGSQIYTRACKRDLGQFLALDYTLEEHRLLNVTLQDLAAWGFLPGQWVGAQLSYADPAKEHPHAFKRVHRMLQATPGTVRKMRPSETDRVRLWWTGVPEWM